MSMTAQHTALELNQAIRKAQSAPLFDPRLASLEKSSFSQSVSATSGLTYYDLETGAKLLFPALTPLRNSIPRVSGKGGIQAAWRAITAVNSTGLRVGVSGGNRGGVAAMTTKDYIATYKGIGIETNVDFEAQYAGQEFRRYPRSRRTDGSRSADARRRGADPRRQYVDGARRDQYADPGRLDLGRIAFGGDAVGDLCRADARRPDQCFTRERHPGFDHARQRRFFLRYFWRRRGAEIGRHNCRRHRFDRQRHGFRRGHARRLRLRLVSGERPAPKPSGPSRRSTALSSPPPPREARPPLLCRSPTGRPMRWCSTAC